MRLCEGGFKNTMSHHYSIQLNIDPGQHYLAAVVKLNYIVCAHTKRLEFILHRDLMPNIKAPLLKDYKCTGPTTYPYAPEAVTWQLEFIKELDCATAIDIEFEYSGRFSNGISTPWEVNRLTAEWVELGLYTPWFPWDPYGGSFTYEVELSIDSNYIVVGTGKVDSQTDGVWTLCSSQPVQDITIAAAPRLRSIVERTGQVKLKLYFIEGQDISIVKSVMEDAVWILGFLQNWFGDEKEERSIDVVASPRVKGGGYARPGLIMMSDLSKAHAGSHNILFKWLAHEFAHLWWAGAAVDTWEDWLNESFAEYSALVAVEKRFGEARLTELVSNMRKKLAGLPPILGLNRTDENAYSVLYIKGALLVYDLEQQIGRDKMTVLLRRRLREQVVTTNGFLTLLRDTVGIELAQQFECLLSQ